MFVWYCERQISSPSQSNNNEFGFKIMALQTPHSNSALFAKGFWLLEP